MSNIVTPVNASSGTRFNNPSGNVSGIPLNGKRSVKPVYAMMAGYAAGSSGTIVGYPLDSLKVWVQTNTLGKNKHLGSKKGPKLPKDTSKKHSTCGKSRSRSTSAKNHITKSSKISGARRSNSTTAVPGLQQRATGAARIIAKPASTVVRTVRALYSGVTGPLVTVGMVQSVNFATYDATRRFLYRRQNPGCCDQDYLTQDSLRNVAASGSMGGMATAVMTAPLLMIKINQQITGNSFRQAFREIFFAVSSKSSSGDRRRFRPFRPYGSAFVPHALSESIGRAIYVTTYEGSKRTMLSSKRSNGDSSIVIDSTSLSLRERMMCAAASGILCWATFFPLDALRNRMYHAASRQPDARATANSILDTVRLMHAERAFYRGFSISILRAGPVAAAVLPVYDLTLERLSTWK